MSNTEALREGSARYTLTTSIAAFVEGAEWALAQPAADVPEARFGNMPAASGEPIGVEAVAEVREGDDGLELRWLVEGGICALVDGCVLVMPHKPITDSDGHGEVYAAPQPAPAPAFADPEALPWLLHIDIAARIANGHRVRVGTVQAIAKEVQALHDTAQPAPARVPPGWSIKPLTDGTVIVSHNAKGGYAAHPAHDQIASAVLAAFATDVLAAAPSPQQEPRP